MTWLKRNRRAATTIGLDEAPEDPIERSPDLEERLLISRDLQVRQALAQLPWEFRETAVLQEMEGLSYKEISARSYRGCRVAAIG